MSVLVIPPCPAHNDSCVEGVAAAPRPACHLTAHEESPHEDHPPDVPLTSTYARRHADPQLFPPHHRWVSAQEHSVILMAQRKPFYNRLGCCILPFLTSM